jgi:amidase
MKTFYCIIFAVCFCLSSSAVQAQSFELEEITVDQLQNLYKSKKYTVRQVVSIYLKRIEEVDKNGPRLNSIIIVNPDALKIADQMDKELKAGKSRGPLHGVPVIIKDNIDTHDKMPTTAGSRALITSIAPKDSKIVEKLREAGAVIIAKANLSEWANFRSDKSSSGWSGVLGQTKNPYDLSTNPCGSSSGSGAAVSANLCVLAIGTETNGSIVCPANANGVVGIKPTVGLISRSGIIPISFSQDTPGPMTRTVKDAAVMLGSLTGTDKEDSKTALSDKNGLKDYTQYLKSDGLKNKRIGIYKGPLGKLAEVDTLFFQAIEQMKKQGAIFVEIDKMTQVKNTNGSSFQVLLYEFKDGLNKYFASLGEKAPVKSLKELIAFNKADSVETKIFDQQLLEMAEAKEDLSSPKYLAALENMLKGTRSGGIDSVMNAHNLDAIIAPTGGPAWETDWKNGDKFSIGSSSPAAIAGYPNISVPMGFVGNLPVGISFFGKAWTEPVLIEIAYAYEQKSLKRKAPQFLK